jgi:demethoxyubiquinone hydroxylase (CLK1/Coq7/Cat5 family)
MTEQQRASSAFDQLVISQAITGELMAVENYARMIPLARTMDEKLFLLDEATHERGHIKSLRNAAKMLGVRDVDGSLDDPYWAKVRVQVVKALESGDLERARFIQDFVLESYAVTLYGAVIPRLGAVLAPRLNAILEDEMQHLNAAVEALRARYRTDPQSCVALVDAVNIPVAGVLATWIAPEDCKPICGVCNKLEGSCGKPELERAGVSTASLAGRFIDVYGSSLRNVGFAPVQVSTWLAELLT